MRDECTGYWAARQGVRGGSGGRGGGHLALVLSVVACDERPGEDVPHDHIELRRLVVGTRGDDGWNGLAQHLRERR